MRTYTEIREFLRDELFVDGKLYSFNEVFLKIREKDGEPLENSAVALCLTNLIREGSVLLAATTEPKTGMVVVVFRLNPVQKSDKGCDCFRGHEGEHNMDCRCFRFPKEWRIQ